MTKGRKQLLNAAIATGLLTLSAPAPKTLSEWMAEHFFLSAESSYTQGDWDAYPFQLGIADLVSHPDVEELTVMKSARVGYTKILLGAIGYFAEHKRRNQALWQPTDEDRDEFVKVELEPMLRDVKIMQRVFPAFMRRHKDNTLQGKHFLGSMLHTRGGKAAKNYRRISVDVAMLDESDAFDIDVEKEGSSKKLAGKRLEGATFPKLIIGSTPKIKGFSQTETSHENADIRLKYHVPCPHCEHEQHLQFGGRDKGFGLKWESGKPETVGYLCCECGVLFTQPEYFQVWQRGRWKSVETGIWFDQAEGVFRDNDNVAVDTPRRVALHLWTIYSPQATWQSLVTEFHEAQKKAKTGDKSDLKTFTNTTLGQPWEEESQRADAHVLERRAENFPLRVVPMGGLMLVAGVDVQGNRFEVTVWAMGNGLEAWTVDYMVIDANPADERDWDLLDAYLATTFQHRAGTRLNIEAAAIDTGGHFTHQTYAYCGNQRIRRRFKGKLFPIKGDPGYGKPIKGRASPQDINWRGKVIRNGIKLWTVNTIPAKDQIYNMLQIETPGPGCMHFSHELPGEFYHQLTAESRIIRRTSTGDRWVWYNPPGRRNEVLDCTVYALFCAHALDLHKYTQRMWQRLDEAIQPANGDLFSGAIPDSESKETKSPRSVVADRINRRRRPAGEGFGRDGWHL